MESDYLSKRWNLLFSDNSQKELITSVYQLIADKYSEKTRFYHTIGHLSHCLREFDNLKHFANHQQECELALWFHDIVYNPKASDNEQQSALLAEQMCRSIGVNETSIHNISEMILLTKHNQIPKTIDQKIVIDCDLSIFGQPTDVFDAYEAGIRQEYLWIPSVIFKPKRKSALQAFLKRPTIYYTQQFIEKYEDKARVNLERSIRQLRWFV